MNTTMILMLGSQPPTQIGFTTTAACEAAKQSFYEQNQAITDWLAAKPLKSYGQAGSTVTELTHPTAAHLEAYCIATPEAATQVYWVGGAILITALVFFIIGANVVRLKIEKSYARQ